jgi:hypothetical protein
LLLEVGFINGWGSSLSIQGFTRRRDSVTFRFARDLRLAVPIHQTLSHKSPIPDTKGVMVE